MSSGHAAALGLAGLALMVHPPPSRSPLRRWGSRWRMLVCRTGRPGTPLLLAVLVGVAVLVLLGPPLGVPAGVAAGWATRQAASRLEPASARQARLARLAELPAVLDLLAVCLRSGLPLDQALDAVATALPGPLTADLVAVASLLKLGAGPAAWQGLAADPVLGPVARAAGRSGESGSALAADFERIAAEHRNRSDLTATVHTRHVALTALAPLALCFLPAFVCLGIVPVVLSVMHQVLGMTG